MAENPTIIALVTVDAARTLDEDLAPLDAALVGQGMTVEQPSWDDPSVDWSRYALALLRSTWDYVDRLPEFLAWVEATARETLLLNPPALVRWNTDKRYLAELAARGLPVIPSTFAVPGGPVEFPESVEWVVKPAVGAGSRGARRFTRDQEDAARQHAAALQAAGRTVLVQPYLSSVEQRGETALMFFDGAYSHAIRKGPLLRVDGGDVQGLYATEDITTRAATADELVVGARTVVSIPGGAPLYARVDLIAAADGTPQILELELTEPSLFFAHAPGSADRFAAAIRRRVGMVACLVGNE
ncbi:MAG TPA: hypothetical protein P5528_06235 [Steroidobacteraceae bacterium]|nr:hypothetical protein [Steroidobacteraceae bacterium]HRX89029.1 hypothetical protein [Steroidobacteraceae bacterium]